MSSENNKPDPEFDCPFAVSEHVLEVTRQAYMAQAFDVFCERFILPQTVGTFHGDQQLETADDLRVVFDNMCQIMDSMRAIDMKRRTLEAKFLNAEQVQATFASQYVLSNLSLTEEVFGHGTLRRVDGIWRIEESRYATDQDHISRALLPKNE